MGKVEYHYNDSKRTEDLVLKRVFLYWLLECKESTFISLILFICVMRNGIGIHGATKTLLQSEVNRNFDYSEYTSSPIFLPIKIVIHGNYFYWLVMNIFMILLVLISFYILARNLFKNTHKFRLAVILFSLSPLVSVMFKTIGYYDPFFYLATILGVLSRKKILIFIASILLASTHSQAACISSLSLYLLLVCGPFKNFRNSKNAEFFAKCSFIMGSSISIFSYFFWRSERYTLIKPGLRDAIYSFFYSLPQHVYCSFGALWLFIFVVLQKKWKWDKRSISAIFISISLTGSVQLITNDGTRISLLILGAVIIVFIAMFSENYFSYIVSQRHIVYAAFIMPAIVVQNIFINPSYRQIVMLIDRLLN